MHLGHTSIRNWIRCQFWRNCWLKQKWAGVVIILISFLLFKKKIHYFLSFTGYLIGIADSALHGLLISHLSWHILIWKRYIFKCFATIGCTHVCLGMLPTCAIEGSMCRNRCLYNSFVAFIIFSPNKLMRCSRKFSGSTNWCFVGALAR